MTAPTDYLVERLVSQQLANNPRTRSLFSSDAMFRASVKQFRTTLAAVATAMQDAAMIPLWQIEQVVQATLNRMLSDRLLDEHDEMVRVATWPLWEKLMAEQYPGRSI